MSLSGYLRPWVSRATACVIISAACGLAWGLAARVGGLLDAKREVSGIVRLAGKPLPSGIIEFQSVVDKTGADARGALIRSGAYSIPAKNGLLPGAYAVRVFSAKSGNGNPSSDTEKRRRGVVPPANEVIPPEFNVSSTQRIEIRETGQNVFDFDIPQPLATPQRSTRQ